MYTSENVYSGPTTYEDLLATLEMNAPQGEYALREMIRRFNGYVAELEARAASREKLKDETATARVRELDAEYRLRLLAGFRTQAEMEFDDSLPPIEVPQRCGYEVVPDLIERGNAKNEEARKLGEAQRKAKADALAKEKADKLAAMKKATDTDDAVEAAVADRLEGEVARTIAEREARARAEAEAKARAEAEAKARAEAEAKARAEAEARARAEAEAKAKKSVAPKPKDDAKNSDTSTKDGAQ